MTIGGAHIAMELWGGIFCLIAALCLHLERTLGGRRGVLLVILVSNALLLFFDCFAWGYRGNGSALGFWAVRISNFLVFLDYQVIMLAFVAYANAAIKEPSRTQVRLTRAIVALCAVTVVMLVVDQFTGTFYAFDQDNRYYRTGLFFVYQLPGIVTMVLAMALVISAREELPKLEFASLMSYAVLPFAGLLASVFIYGISLLNIGITVSALTMFASHLVANSRALVEQERSLSDARAGILVSQIGPHFLYNTLSTIGALCTIDPKLASEATDQLARYMRGNLDGIREARAIPFEREMEHVTTYLWLEQLRFGSDLRVRYDIADEDFLLPALSVQPLVENAVKHGMMGREGVCTIEIGSRREAGAHVVTVSDDGAGFDTNAALQDGRAHVGIESVRARLGSFVGGTLEVKSEPGVGTVATIVIPDENRAGEKDAGEKDAGKK